MNAIELIKKSCKGIENEELILAALEEISKPIDMKQVIEICNGCKRFKVECICNEVAD